MANIRRMTKKRLGELLLQEGLINEEQLETGLEEQQQTGELVGEILVRKGYVTESDIARTICTQFSFPFLSVSHYYIAPEMVTLFSLEELEKHLFVPIDRFGDVLGIVVAGLLDQEVLDEIEKHTSCSIQVYVGTVTDVKSVIKEKFAAQRNKAGKPKEAAKAAPAEAADVTAPPAAATHTAVADEDVLELDESVITEEDAPASEADENVVKELEEQFKKFHFFDDENGKKQQADKSPEE